MQIFLDEPSLLREYAVRIGAERFGEPSLRRIYATMCDRQSSLAQPADVFALFSGDGDVSATLASIAGAERSRIVRFPDSDARRAHLDRLIERFSADDKRRRFREVDAQIVALFEAGQPIPQELREELDALHRARLKG